MTGEQTPQFGTGLAGVVVETLPITHADSRRFFTEFFDSAQVGIGGVKVMNIEQPPTGQETVVGGHWEKGLEVIFVQSGSISRLLLADVNTREERSYKNIGANSRVILPPNIAHRLSFRQPASLIILNEVPFSPAKLVPYPFRG